jgi:hypothetical protein
MPKGNENFNYLINILTIIITIFIRFWWIWGLVKEKVSFNGYKKIKKKLELN